MRAKMLIYAHKCFDTWELANWSNYSRNPPHLLHIWYIYERERESENKWLQYWVRNKHTFLHKCKERNYIMLYLWKKFPVWASDITIPRYFYISLDALYLDSIVDVNTPPSPNKMYSSHYWNNSVLYIPLSPISLSVGWYAEHLLSYVLLDYVSLSVQTVLW